MDFTPTKDQAKALAAAKRLYEASHDRVRVTVIAGVAGSGKSTLLGVIAKEFGRPMVVTPTGKAAVRVREAAGLDARTIHSWVYSADEDEYGEPIFQRKGLENMDTGEAGVLVIDEASMVGETLWNDVYDACKMCRLHVLVVGDPAQLPPVLADDEDEDFSLVSEDFRGADERVELLEIVRQAWDSPIIRGSALVRAGDIGKAVMQLPRVTPSTLLDKAESVVRSGGMVICHKNTTRQELNRALRQRLGRHPDRLETGEPLLVVKNSAPLELYNGEIHSLEYWVEEPQGLHVVRDRFKKVDYQSRFGLAAVNGRTNAVLCEQEVLGNLAGVSPKAVVKTARVIFGTDVNHSLHANLGYAMTCHKAQGSQADQVLVVLESSVQAGKPEGRRWLYTALTRAVKEVTVCMGYKSV